jgi:RNA polymerase sigma-70 factor (ECF subfamily)
MKPTAGGHTFDVKAIAMTVDESPEPRARSLAPEKDARVRALVRDHLDFTWRSLRRLGLPPDVADDAVQRVFVVVNAKLDSIKPGSERAFLFNTALRIASSEKRTFARRREVMDGETADAVGDSAVAVDEQLGRHQARAVLEDLLQELEMDMRAVFVLFELEELSTVEIAATLEIPMGTVSSRLRRARDEFQAAAKRYQARSLSSGRGRTMQGAMR